MADEKRKVSTEIALELNKSNLQQVADDIRAQVQKIKSVLQELGSEGKYSVGEIEGALRSLNKTSKQFDGEAITQAVDSLKQGEESTDGFTGSMSKMGNVAQFIFGTVLGISAVGVLQQIIGLFEKARDNAIEMSSSMFSLEIGIRQLRRSGLDVTFEGAVDTIAELSDRFKHLSQVDLVELTAMAYNLTSTMGLTEQQVQEVIETSIGMASANKKDVLDNLKALIAGMNGYLVTLRDAGVAIDDIMVRDKAYAMQLAEEGSELSLNATHTAALALAYDKMKEAITDVEKYSDTAAGSLDELKAKNEALSTSFGTIILPAWVAFKQGIYDAVVAILQFLALASILPMAIENALGGTWTEIAKINAKFIDFVANLQNGLSGIESAFDDEVPLGTGTLTTEVDDAATKEGIDLLKSLEDIALQEERKRRDAKEKLMDKLEDIEQDYADKIIDINEDLQQRLEDIERNYTNKRDDAYRDYLEKVEDANKKFDEDIEKAHVDANDKELKREQSLQDKLLKLREQFIMSLEDALRDRNVRQALRLKQEYDLNKKQLLRQNDLDKDANAKKLQQDLKDLATARARKLDELRLEYSRRLEELALFQSREIASARRGYDQDIAELNIWLERKRKDAMEGYDQDIRDIRKWSNDKLYDLARAYNDQNQVTIDGLNAMYQSMLAYMGPNGYIDGLYQYLLQMTGATMAEIQEAMRLTFADTDYTATIAPNKTGGQLVPSSRSIYSPTVPTRTVRPLQPSNRFPAINNTSTITQGEAVVQIQLSEGLVGDIINNSLNAVAIELERQ